jgi:hypothetical protein
VAVAEKRAPDLPGTRRSGTSEGSARMSAGKIYLWTYPEGVKDYAGWHLTADAAGCQMLLATLDRVSTDERARPLQTFAPNVAILTVPNNRRASAQAAAAITVVHARDRDAAYWHLEVTAGGVALSVGTERLAALRAAVVDVSQGRGDYCLGSAEKRAPRQERLWFWWMPK